MSKKAASLVCEKAPRLACHSKLWKVYINPDFSIEERKKNYMNRQSKRNKASEAAMGAGALSVSKAVITPEEGGIVRETTFESSQQQRNFVISKYYGDGIEDEFEDAIDNMEDANDSRNYSVDDIRHYSTTEDTSCDISTSMEGVGSNNPTDNGIEEGGEEDTGVGNGGENPSGNGGQEEDIRGG